MRDPISKTDARSYPKGHDILNRDFSCKFGSFSILLKEQHVNDSNKCGDGKDQSDRVHITGKEPTELSDHECDYISKSALISDCKPGPLCTVHLSSDSTDCCISLQEYV